MNIIKYRKIFLAIGATIVLVAAGLVLSLGLKPGIDFTGGALTEVRFETMPEKAVVETTLAESGYGEAAVRRSSGELGESYIVTTRTLNLVEQSALEEKLLGLGAGGSVVRNTSVGPVIGNELKDKAYYALGAVLLITIIYVAFAFRGVATPVNSWVYGSMTVLVLVHDILVPIALMSVLGYVWGFEIDVLFVTALLTILGYSVNDTIVIFDRIREKLVEFRTEKHRKINEPGGIVRTEIEYTLTKPFGEIVGQAISETMARSINTSLTVLLALIVLYIFGSVVTQTFILVLMAGVVAGAYSSIFIASPLLVVYAEWQNKKNK